MIHPGLTFEEGRRNIGWFPVDFEWSIDESDPLTVAWKDFQAVWFAHNPEKPWETEPAHKRAHINLNRAIDNCGINGFLGSPRRLMSKSSDYINAVFQQFFRELILNAIEHGSDFCRAGKVEVNALMGTRGLVLSVVQPKLGLSDRLHELSKSDPWADTRYINEHGAKRGNGSRELLNLNTPSVWSEDLQSGGSRAVAAWTRKQVKKVAAGHVGGGWHLGGSL